MHTIKNILSLSEDYLANRGVKNARKEAGEIIAQVLQVKRIDLYQSFEQPLIEEELEIIRIQLKRRSKLEPLAYIHQKVAFYQCELEVNPHVLIPRQETEILVDKIVHKLRSKTNVIDLWDLCTGSGCIGIALKKTLPHLTVSLSDLSKDALKTAKSNALNNQVDVDLLQGDLFEPFCAKKTDIIVCNPPYISQKNYATLDADVRLYEPKMALVADDDGLLFYKRIAAELKNHLKPQGLLFLEIGYDQKHAIEAAFSKKGYKKFYFEKDWAGKDRFFFLEIE